MARRQRQMCIRDRYNTGEEELYNNSNDPKEWNNLIFNKTHPKTQELRNLLKEMTYPVVPQGFSNINK